MSGGDGEERMEPKLFWQGEVGSLDRLWLVVIHHNQVISRTIQPTTETKQTTSISFDPSSQTGSIQTIECIFEVQSSDMGKTLESRNIVANIL